MLGSTLARHIPAVSTIRIEGILFPVGLRAHRVRQLCAARCERWLYDEIGRSDGGIYSGCGIPHSGSFGLQLEAPGDAFAPILLRASLRRPAGQILSRPMRYAVLLEHREASPRSEAVGLSLRKDVDPGDHEQYIRRPDASPTPEGPFMVNNAEGFALESVESLWLFGDGSRRRCLV